ncbi:hypothetical protein N7453_007279 [Penicillium expansum]|nr:hypothetical protein N7453_007279 [Penicillium expansum]
METIRRAHLKSLAHRGTIQGVTISTLPSPTSQAKDLCHYFGGVRYGLAPVERWRRAQPLPASFTYGSEEVPGRCDGGAGLCPQPGFLNISPENPDAWDEDCFQCNVWTPIGEVPEGGWPVFVFIQTGTRVDEGEHPAIRRESGGHHDRRIPAGANSVFHQLAYDLRQPDENSLVRQACIWSNSPAVQPKQPTETQTQFNQLLTALDIPLTLSHSEKLTRLRSIPAKTLLEEAKTIPLHQFRPTTDNSFISESLFTTLDTGAFARSLLARNVRIIIGECRDERFLYSTWFPPTEDTLSALRIRLIADYPEHIVDAVIPLYYPDGRLPTNCKNWDQDAWGRIYADMQVHQMQRGLAYAMTENEDGVDASALLFRYRIEWRAKCVEAVLPIEWGVTHSSDYPIWFFGNGGLLGEGEKGIVKDGFVGPLGRFVSGGGRVWMGDFGGKGG